MKLLAGFMLAALPVLALAQTPDAPVPAAKAPTAQSPAGQARAAPPPDPWQPRPVAEVQALDKITARATPLSIRIGQSATFGSLTIAVRACMVRAPDQAADTAMFLDIIDSHQGAPQFHGWMIVSAPGAAMLEHPVYDVRPSGCHA